MTHINNYNIIMDRKTEQKTKSIERQKMAMVDDTFKRVGLPVELTGIVDTYANSFPTTKQGIREKYRSATPRTESIQDAISNDPENEEVFFRLITDPRLKLSTLHKILVYVAGKDYVNLFVKLLNNRKINGSNLPPPVANNIDRVIKHKCLEKRQDAFIQMCINGNLAMAQWLWSLIPRPPNHRTRNDIAFRGACANGHLRMAQWLWSVDLGNHPGQNVINTAFQKACVNGHISVAKWLWDVVPFSHPIISNVKKVHPSVREWLSFKQLNVDS